jgi:hypothetical protein
MSRHASSCFAVVFVAVLATAGCESVDLKTAAQVVDVSTGYYDNGLTPGGLNHMVPSITFSVKNVSDRELSSVDMMVLYWAVGQDTEQDESFVKVIGGSGLPSGATSEPVVSRSRIGFTLEGARSELFTHSKFTDWTAKLFLKRGGKIVPAGEYKIERKLLLAAPTPPK